MIEFRRFLSSLCVLFFIAAQSPASASQGLTDYYETQSAAPVISDITVVVDPRLVKDNPAAPRSRTPETPWPLARAEADMLSAFLEEELKEQLGHGGAYSAGGTASLRVAIVAAEPSNLRFTRAGASSGLLDGSVSRGGATVAADFTDADGNTVAIYSYSYYEPALELATSQGLPWKDAQRALANFARQLARSIQEHNGAQGQ